MTSYSMGVVKGPKLCGGSIIVVCNLPQHQMFLTKRAELARYCQEVSHYHTHTRAHKQNLSSWSQFMSDGSNRFFLGFSIAPVIIAPVIMPLVSPKLRIRILKHSHRMSLSCLPLRRWWVSAVAFCQLCHHPKVSCVPRGLPRMLQNPGREGLLMLSRRKPGHKFCFSLILRAVSILVLQPQELDHWKITSYY